MFRTKVVESHNTHSMFNNFSQKSAFYEIMCKNMVESATTQMTI